jgi:hypothetical protein
MKDLVRLLREPLLHFFAFGGLIFLFYTAVSGPAPEPVDTIVIAPERIQQLATGFQGVWQRPPSSDELRALVDDFVREEIYYREALALGLDRNDTVIRRRLRQKMEFLTDTGADLFEPSTEELEVYLAANEQTYRREPRLAFEQVFLGEAPAPARIEASLDAFQADPAADPSQWGERTLLPAQLDLSPPDAVDGVFGKGFFDRLAKIPRGVWAGPVESAYGIHLVRITDSLPARMPALEEVHDAVLRDWKAAKALELRERYYARLLERYVIKLPGTGTPSMQSP